MCVPGQPAAPPAPPASTGQALAVLHGALCYLAGTDAAALTTAEQADCLRGLERAESVRIAARARVLSAFSADRGFEDDGHGSARSWLRWQARITGPAASAAMAWTRRLAAHLAIRDALAAGQISVSWARQICDWTDLLPASARGDADTILLAAAAAGAGLADLAGLAEEIRNRTAEPDQDGEDGFNDRSLRLDLHYRGHGRLRGDLTPRCAAALQAILNALGKKAGPEDTRTRPQRDHDAIEEACRRLIAAGTVPDRAGQATQIQLHITLDQLTGLIRPDTEPPQGGYAGPPPSPGPHHTSPAGGIGRAEGNRPPAPRPDGRAAAILGIAPYDLTGQGTQSWTGPGPHATPGDLCDASIVPVVTGHVDHELLDRLASDLLSRTGPGNTNRPDGTNRPGGQTGSLQAEGLAHGYARELVLANAVALLSGPTGLASRLRTSHLHGPAASISLPLDTGATTDTIPPHLRRAVILRDIHCAFPGCVEPHCQVHHIIPRSEGGSTCLGNLALGCSFHHLIAIHKWGWKLILNADGTKTAISPDGTRILRSHSPPNAA